MKEHKLFKGLTQAFSYAFEEYQKQGGNIKDLFWFKSESEKMELLKLEEYQCPEDK